MCCLSRRFKGNTKVIKVQYDEDPYLHKLEELQKEIDEAELIVGFNLKYDIHWGRRYGLRFVGKRIWDCQLYHFIQSNQSHRMPSMDEVAQALGVPTKIDVVKTEYWEKGLDTDQVPWYILEEYSAWDVDPVNEQIFLKQMEEFKTLPENRRKLILLHMRDLLVLEEMEYNGSFYNVNLSIKMGEDLERQISSIDGKLAKYCPNVPISFNSDEQISAFLYGGIIRKKELEKYVFHYKDAKKASVEKERWVVKEYNLPRIFTPLERTEMAKEGVFSTDKKTLQKLRFRATGFQGFILDLLLERSKLEKRKSTYCFGTPRLMEEMGWEGQLLHGQLNQTVVVTGRLSCAKPNLQNQEEAMQICFESRFKWNN